MLKHNHLPLKNRIRKIVSDRPMIDTFTDTYDLYNVAILRYCIGKCRDPQLGQDLMQDTFLRFWLCLQQKKSIQMTRAFLYCIARNLIIDSVRKKKADSLDELLETGFEPSIDLWHQTHSHLDAEKPLAQLAKMEKSYRKVLHCRFMLDLPPAEIATMTGESSNTVSVRIFRGLKHLRLLLDTPVRKTTVGEVAPISSTTADVCVGPSNA